MSKQNSIKRAFDLYQNKSITEIAIIQSAYAQKDYTTLKQIFNKHNVSNSTLEGYARLGNQYIKHISQPNTNVKKFVEKTYSESLESTQNLVKNAQNNAELILNAQKIKKGALYPNFSNQKRFNNRKNADSISNNAIIPFDYQEIKQIRQFNEKLNQNITFHNKKHKNKIKYVRITVKYRTSDNEEHFYSTKKVKPSQIKVESLQMIKDLDYNDFKHWKSISPKNEDLIQDLYTTNLSITEILDYQIEYYY